MLGLSRQSERTGRRLIFDSQAGYHAVEPLAALKAAYRWEAADLRRLQGRTPTRRSSRRVLRARPNRLATPDARRWPRLCRAAIGS